MIQGQVDSRVGLQGSRSGLEVESRSGLEGRSRLGSEVEGLQRIQEDLQERTRKEEGLIKVIERLKVGCIFCELIYGNNQDEEGKEHLYEDCQEAREKGVSLEQYQE